MKTHKIKPIVSVIAVASVVAAVVLSLCLKQSRHQTVTPQTVLTQTNQFGGDLSVQRISEFIYSAHRLSQTLNCTVTVSYTLKGELRTVDFTPDGRSVVR